MQDFKFFIDTPFLSIFFLFAASMITIFSTAILFLGKYKSTAEIKNNTKLFFFRPLLHRFFTKNGWENLYLLLSFSKHILLLLYAASAFFFFLIILESAANLLLMLFITLCIIAISIAADFLMRLFAMIWPKGFLKISAPFSSFFLFLFLPIIGPLLKIIRFFFKIAKIEEEDSEDFPIVRDRIKEMIRDTELNLHLDLNDQKLLTSFVTFRERVVKEIMVPRIDVISLNAHVPIKTAATLFLEEGYSRIPVYKDTLDEIVGVLLYKDLLNHYSESEDTKRESFLASSIESLIKPVIYVPENKKISHLLQEFRAQQLHLAIVVDEYGGTEGIVTIEDILEELVGEIEDEYDFDEEVQFWKLPSGGWVVDAKMSIIDIENKIGIQIPHHHEYETIGGYIFHKAGTIPSKGWSIHHDKFDLEVLSSSERSIEKIRITPKTKP